MKAERHKHGLLTGGNDQLESRILTGESFAVAHDIGTPRNEQKGC